MHVVGSADHTWQNHGGQAHREGMDMKNRWELYGTGPLPTPLGEAFLGAVYLINVSMIWVHDFAYLEPLQIQIDGFLKQYEALSSVKLNEAKEKINAVAGQLIFRSDAVEHAGHSASSYHTLVDSLFTKIQFEFCCAIHFSTGSSAWLPVIGPTPKGQKAELTASILTTAWSSIHNKMKAFANVNFELIQNNLIIEVSQAAKQSKQLAQEKAVQDHGEVIEIESMQPVAKHNADFTMVNWFGTEYQFALGVQSSAVKALWEEWEKSGLGLSQQTIRGIIDAERDAFRMVHVFRNHPAWKTMIHGDGKGRYRIVKPKLSKDKTKNPRRIH